MPQVTLPPEMELKTFIELVSQCTRVRFLYDEGVANKRISINSPRPIPVDSILDVLRSALKMKGLALVDDGLAGWMKIVPAEDLVQIAGPPNGQTPTSGGGGAVTQTFTLLHIQPDRVQKVIEPFLTKKGANIVVVADKNLLIITDYAPNLRRIAQLIELVDQAGPERILKFLRIDNVDASELSAQISQALTARGPAQVTNGPAVTVSADKRTNQLVVVGTQSQIDDVLQLVRAFDVPLHQRTHVYQFRHVDAERVDKLLKQTIDPLTAEHLYHSAVDRSDNFLVATGPERVHERIVQLAKELDLETLKRGSSGLKFYRLKYADAQEVLNTLRAIEQRGSGPGDSAMHGGPPTGRGGVGGPQNGTGNFDSSSAPPSSTNGPSASTATPNTNQREVSLNTQSGPAGPNGPPGLSPMPGGPAAGGGSIVPGAARVSIDTKSNSLIVIADRPVQQVYEELIRALDRPRPQVMIEAKIVILDTSDNYSLGVEVSAPVVHRAAQILQFSSFGLSTVSAATGALALNPAQGFNWALVDPSAASAVIQAMANHSRSKVLSAPRLLVADNSTGNLASVQEVPYTSVNASTTVATTSFAGFAEAGTTIQVQPRIMDDNHLQLQFNVSLNSFTGSGSNGVPPPRQTDQISSKVTVPDGYTVIVGGLTNRNNSSSQNGIPWVECVPILKDLTSLQTKSSTQTTLFVFLRPVIMRDDKFRDLKYLSDSAIQCAREPGNYPESCPLLVR
ncbi:MAG TPA: secretin N-terminal domain-containing protein [Planctomycetaceae bacterium]|nr:secretin N-terminal domain-containing protein [Planctomycetaceae bacterium]